MEQEGNEAVEAPRPLTAIQQLGDFMLRQDVVLEDDLPENLQQAYPLLLDHGDAREIIVRLGGFDDPVAVSITETAILTRAVR